MVTHCPLGTILSKSDISPYLWPYLSVVNNAGILKNGTEYTELLLVSFGKFILFIYSKCLKNTENSKTVLNCCLFYIGGLIGIGSFGKIRFTAIKMCTTSFKEMDF